MCVFMLFISPKQPFICKIGNKSPCVRIYAMAEDKLHFHSIKYVGIWVYSVNWTWLNRQSLAFVSSAKSGLAVDRLIAWNLGNSFCLAIHFPPQVCQRHIHVPVCTNSLEIQLYPPSLVKVEGNWWIFVVDVCGHSADCYCLLCKCVTFPISLNTYETTFDYAAPCILASLR